MKRYIIYFEDAHHIDDDLATFLENRDFQISGTEGMEYDALIYGERKASIILSANKARQLRKQGLLGGIARKFGADRILSITKGDTFDFQISMSGSLGEITIHDDTSLFQRELISYFMSGPDVVAAQDPSTFKLLNLARKVASSDVTAMIVGESGTGKEVIAKYIHNRSKRADKPFVAVNCAAVPDSMLEAMLFGYEKGAFTGAHQASKGIFRAAESGTLLLDEISEMPLGLQSKLLRVLQEREVTPLGGVQTLPVDVRVIATSNRNMLTEAREGRFREDLFYRLNVFPIQTQPLHQRVDDILPIAVALIVRHSAVTSKISGITNGAVERLKSYHWPGNVRELENVLQRAVVLSEGGIIGENHLMVDEMMQNVGKIA